MRIYVDALENEHLYAVLAKQLRKRAREGGASLAP
jgi:hypothetical protein